MSGGVHVVALGARTAVGLTAEGSAAAVRAGVSRIAGHPVLLDAAGEPLGCAWDGAIDPTLQGPQRFVDLAVGALTEVLGKVTAHKALPGSLPIVVALPSPRPGFGADAAHAVVRGIGTAALPGSPRVEVEPVGGGHAASVRALEMGLAHISSRRADICLVAGVDSYLDADGLDWLEGEGRLAREDLRGGFSPGEGAGVVAIASRAARSWMGLPSLASIKGVATGKEKRSRDSAEGLLGEGLAEVISRVAAGLRLPQENADDIYLDINGERHRTDDWGMTVLRVPSAMRDGTEYISATGNWGDVGAASGVLGCVLACEAWRRGRARGARALVCASSDEGMRGAVLLEKVEG